MQTPTPNAQPRRQRRRPQISCTECRRRKQKCNPRKDGPCANCLRRYPAVPCFVQDLDNDLPVRSLVKQEYVQYDHEPGPSTPRISSEQELLSTAAHSETLSYPTIPLSRILHCIDDTYSYNEGLQYGNEASGHGASHDYLYPMRGFVVEDDLEHSDGHTPAQRRLRFLDPTEPMYTRYESPRAIGGVLSMLNTINTMPVKTTLRNTELFHFFHNRVAPTFCSIDGSFIAPLFAREILPWMMHSPLMPNVAILMASAAQSNAGIGKSSETLLIKSHVLSLVNQFIQEDFCLVGNQALRIVIHLVVLELFWGAPENIWPHMEGIKQMLKLRGGLDGMNDPLNAHILVVTDYELACAFERELDLQSMEVAISTLLPIRETYPEGLRCPLLEYPVSFRESREELGLSAFVAEVLDDVRFLTVMITSCFLSPEREAVRTEKIQSTAAWLHTRLSAHPLPLSTPSRPVPITTLIAQTIHLTALMYTLSISALTPLSLSFFPSQLSLLHTNLSLVGLHNWKEIPGIFLWILLVATPSARNDKSGRWMRKQMACTGMSIGLEDFHFGTRCLRGMWLVQRWVEREGGGSGRGVGRGTLDED